MASIHIVGELLGASGLSCPAGQEAFSVAHVLDLLSLHPSSEFSYFCKWRLVVDDPVKSSNEDSSWKVIQGETRGQTQVHARTSDGSLSMPDLCRHASGKQKHILLPKMDTVWAHPIELHLAATNMDVWSCWPRLEFQVWSLDRFQLETLCGRASIPIPLATNEFVLDLPIVLQEPSTLLGYLTRAVGLPFQDFIERSKDDYGPTIRSTAAVYLRLAVLARGLNT